MTFDELRLCMAIHKASLGGKERTKKADRHRAVGIVFWNWLNLFGDSRFPWNIDDVVHWAVSYRKDKGKRMKVEIALAHGDECYFKHRGKGDCCNVVEWGHVVPRCRGGADTVENGQIECHSHNHQRGVNGNVMSIEEYLLSPLTTSETTTAIKGDENGKKPD